MNAIRMSLARPSPFGAGLSFSLCLFGWVVIRFYYQSRFDDREEFENLLFLARIAPAPLALGGFVLALDVARRWVQSRRFCFALIVAGTFWLFGWLLLSGAYWQRLVDGGLPWR